jgi:hypothetical protein
MCIKLRCRALQGRPRLYLPHLQSRPRSSRLTAYPSYSVHECQFLVVFSQILKRHFLEEPLRFFSLLPRNLQIPSPRHLISLFSSIIMPKGHSSVRSQGYYRTSPVSSTQGTTQYHPISIPQYTPLSSRPSTTYFPHSPLSTIMPQQSYTQQPTYVQGGPVQPVSQPVSQPQYALFPSAPSMSSIRPSSGAWNPQDDQTLMAARHDGMNWGHIQQAYFPTKTPNACRKRHERLMEKKSADDWDSERLENLAKQYMAMRREIWSGLAAATGEKWMVVEQKVCSPHRPSIIDSPFLWLPYLFYL